MSTRFATLVLLPVLLILSGCIHREATPGEIQVRFHSNFPQQIKQYVPVEVQFNLDHLSLTNPYDRDEISVDLLLNCPDGSELTHPAFYTVDHEIFLDHGKEVIRDSGRGHWEVRWTPTQSGDYRWAILATIKSRSTRVEGKSSCESTSQGGFARVSVSDPKYFELSDGTFFYPIGHVIRSPSDSFWMNNDRRRLEAHNAYMDQKTFAYERWFEQMEENHENFCLLWMTPWWLGIEWTRNYPGYEGLGRYNQIHAAQLDRILKSAERHGIYVFLFVMNHGQLSTVIDAEWEANPYRRANGGPAEMASDVFENESCDKLYQQRLTYILARWGYSPALFGISLSTEVEWVEPYFGQRCNNATEVIDGISRPSHKIPKNTDCVIDWLRRLSQFVRTKDIHQHLVTVQFAHLHQTDGVWETPEFDFIISNCYESAFPYLSKLVDFESSLNGTPDLFLKWSHIHDFDFKPRLLGEWGGSHLGNSSQEMKTDLHAGLWSLTMTECGGATGFWWWNEIDKSKLYPEFGAISNFMEGYDRRNKNLKESLGSVSSRVSTLNPAESSGFSYVPHASRSAILLSNETEAFAYIYEKIVSSGYATPIETYDSTLDPVSDTYLKMPDHLKAGRYRIEFWNTTVGKILETKEVELGEAGNVSRQVALAPMQSDLAIKVIRIDDDVASRDSLPKRLQPYSISQSSN